MTKEEFVRNLMESDRDGVDRMTVEQAADILDWMRSDDEDGAIPEDLTAEELAAIWNEIKGIDPEDPEPTLWYAIMTDSDDSDWGTGTHDRDAAIARVKAMLPNHPDAYIAVIEEGDNPVCIDTIRDFEED